MSLTAFAHDTSTDRPRFNVSWTEVADTHVNALRHRAADDAADRFENRTNKGEASA